MTNSPKMLWVIPDENAREWGAIFASLVTAQDASCYASREDRSIVFLGGGVIIFNSGTGVLSWSSAFNLISPIAGYKITISSGSKTLTDGQFLYVNMPRSPTASVTASALVANTLPNTDDALCLAVRVGSNVFFRNGTSTISSGGGGDVDQQLTVASGFQDFTNSAGANFITSGTGPGHTGVAEIVDSSYGAANTPGFVGSARLGVSAPDATGPVDAYVDLAPPSSKTMFSDVSQGLLTVAFRCHVTDVQATPTVTTLATLFATTGHLACWSCSLTTYGNNHWWVITPTGNHDSGVVIDITNAHRFKIVADPAGPTIDYYYDNVLKYTHNGALSDSLLPGADLSVDGSGGGAGDVVIDYISWSLAIDRT